MTGCHYLSVTVTGVTPSAARGRKNSEERLSYKNKYLAFIKGNVTTIIVDLVYS